MRTPTFIANWKMNQTQADLAKYVVGLQQALSEIPQKGDGKYEVVLAPMAVHLTNLKQLVKNTPFKLSAQNSGPTAQGAYTGENGPAALKEIGCDYVIIGHSERRHAFKEDDLLILSRVRTALEQDLKVILCVGEVLQDRKAGRTFKVVESQLSILKKDPIPSSKIKDLIIAYEPVWAIGTGENATPAQAQEVHVAIRTYMETQFGSIEGQQLRIVYGGSVKADNAASLMKEPDVDGVLVGGASLDPNQFSAIIRNGLKNKLKESL